MKKSVRKLCQKEEFIQKKLGEMLWCFYAGQTGPYKVVYNSSCMMSLQCCNRLITTPGNFTTNFAETQPHTTNFVFLFG